ncbi:OpgC family protein [Rhodoligotrophos ferricapiens]|uniref:OpgC family protein n=1 Tax=Rhodoligotrophos ferricapiens TaxID=3069264 RepID=UPI00315D158A
MDGSGLAAPSRQNRDYRIDFWRGVALVMIFINHIPGNLFESFTSRNFGVSDAAELFVLLAGVSAAFAYHPSKPIPVFPTIVFKAFARAWKLYASHILTCVICIGVLVGSAYVFQDSTWLETHGLKSFFDSPELGMFGLAALGFQPAYLNILPMYILFMLGLPLLVVTARVSLVATFALSALLYVSAQIYGLRFTVYPERGFWFFNPMAWQFLFVIGYIFGTLSWSGFRLPYRPILFFGAVGYLIFCLVIVRFQLWPNPNALSLPSMLWQFNKNDLHLPRLLHVLAIVYVVMQTPLHSHMRSLGPNNILVTFGRHSLAIFCTGSVLSMIGQVLRNELGGGLVGDIMIVGGGLILLYLTVQLIEWKQEVLSGAARRANTNRAEVRSY